MKIFVLYRKIRNADGGWVDQEAITTHSADCEDDAFSYFHDFVDMNDPDYYVDEL